MKRMRDYSLSVNLSASERAKREIIHRTYRLQRTNINKEFNQYLIGKYCNFTRTANFWDLFDKLDGIVDLSDPDTSLPNSIHALQTAEAIHNDANQPDWMALCGLIHDMGKILYLDGCDVDGTSKETQWALVGDTFATGLSISDSVVLPEYNSCNKDHTSDSLELPAMNCGLHNLSMSFGHDEYMYRLLIANRHNLPLEAEYIIRYHSLYLWHTENAYSEYENQIDAKMKPIVQQFNKYDLYTKDDSKPLAWTPELRAYYSQLVVKYISSNLIIKY